MLQIQQTEIPETLFKEFGLLRKAKLVNLHCSAVNLFISVAGYFSFEVERRSRLSCHSTIGL